MKCLLLLRAPFFSVIIALNGACTVVCRHLQEIQRCHRGWTGLMIEDLSALLEYAVSKGDARVSGHFPRRLRGSDAEAAAKASEAAAEAAKVTDVGRFDGGQGKETSREDAGVSLGAEQPDGIYHGLLLFRGQSLAIEADDRGWRATSALIDRMLQVRGTHSRGPLSL